MQSRKAAFKVLKGDNLCKSLFDGADSIIKCPFEKCKFVHDIEKYLSEKPADIPGTCYIYSTKGFCARGVTCRFAHAHLDENLNNQKSELYDPNAPKTTVNQISPGKLAVSIKITTILLTKNNFEDLQMILRKRSYNFDLSKKTIAEMDKLKTEQKKSGSTVDTDLIRERPVEKKKVDFREKLLLSPLTTVGNLPFRRICKEFGADVTCGK